jgi:hypothetical protein
MLTVDSGSQYDERHIPSGAECDGAGKPKEGGIARAHR